MILFIYMETYIILIISVFADDQTLSGVEHIGSETKWLPFSKQHFEMDFREWKYMNFD